MAALYKTSLLSIAPGLFGKGDGNAKAIMEDKSWEALQPFVSQEILDDAHAQVAAMNNAVFGPCNISALPRPCKTLARVQEKLKLTKPDAHFKANSDFLAFTVAEKDPRGIASVVASLSTQAQCAGGVSFRRNSITTASGDVNDIVQYMLMFIPSIGYVVEIQVGHPFASYTFQLDSAKRASADRGKCVDLWDDDFYALVKANILHPQSQGTAAEAKARLQAIVKDKASPSPDEVKNVLHPIITEYFKSE
jgi:hypothetical protein